jgi:tRNA (guanine-N7-)-methyltransferase
MAKNKLKKFADIRLLKNVYECYNVQQPSLQMGAEMVEMTGKWREKHFKNQHPIVLELACGGGEYTVELARRFPDRNFIGVDLKGNRIWKGASIAETENLTNVAFVRTRIEVIENFFSENEVDEIWITFPDPFLREGKSRRRLTSAPFLEKYRLFLKKNGLVHLKTDERKLYDFTLETLVDDARCNLIFHDDDIHAKPHPIAELDIKTYYESKDIAGEKKVKYVRFSIC